MPSGKLNRVLGECGRAVRVPSRTGASALPCSIDALVFGVGRIVRVGLFASIPLLSFSVAIAQKQEEGLLERVTGLPDLEQGNAMQKKSFLVDGDFGIKSATGSDRTASDVAPFLAREYRQTRSFLGIKNPWFGSKVAPTKPASFGDTIVLNSDRVFATREATTRAVFDADRSVFQPDEAVPTRTYSGEGSAQGALDPFSTAANKKLTVEEVRELLNKNH